MQKTTEFAKVTKIIKFNKPLQNCEIFKPNFFKGLQQNKFGVMMLITNNLLN